MFPVHHGIPRFVDAARLGAADITRRTQRAYSFTWRRTGERELAQQWEKDSYQYVELLPRALWTGESRVGLDAGCGGGADLVRLASGGAQLIGCDLSEGVDVAAQAAAHLPNVLVVQADLHRLPFRPQTFDFIYSFGVLHHLPDPQEGMRRLAALLKPGGSLMVYLYEDFSEKTRVERAMLSAIRAVRRLTSRLPFRWLATACWALAPLVWLICCVPARLLRRLWPRAADRIPFRHTLRWSVVASDLFDRFAPPVEWRFSRSQVHDLYVRAGLERVEIRWHRGWVAWAFKPAPLPEAPSGREEVATVSAS